MGVIVPKGRGNRAYFGCSAAACLGLAFWALIACCLALIVLGLSTELESGDAELVSAYYALSQIMVGSLAFCFSMAAMMLVFIGFGLYRQTRQFLTVGEAHSLNEVLLFFFLFVAGMILGAALPTLALEYPETNAWIAAGGVLAGVAFLLYGLLMLWLTLTAYETYRHREEGEV